MIAFEKIPGVTLPAATATNAARVFELRTYESPSDLDHKRKVEMMQSGEELIFAKAGFTQVFYGDTLIGGHLPNLTYMLSFESLATRDQHWSAFAHQSRLESDASQPALRLRRHRLQHFKLHPDASVLLANLNRSVVRSHPRFPIPIKRHARQNQQQADATIAPAVPTRYSPSAPARPRQTIPAPTDIPSSDTAAAYLALSSAFEIARRRPSP